MRPNWPIWFAIPWLTLVGATAHPCKSLKGGYLMLSIRTTAFRAAGLRAVGGTFLALLPLAMTPASGAVFYVGSGTDCDTSTLDGAVGAAAFTIGEDDEIRITATLSNISRELRNFDPATIGAITIRGGYADCTGTPNASGYGALLGFGSDPVLEIVADGATSKVTLRDLIVSRFGTARAITVTGGDAQLFLEGTRIEFNDGGGTLTNGPVLVDIDRYSEIQNNDSFGSPGGGISCTGSRIVVAGDIVDNQTTSSGGGIFATAGCDVVVEAGARFLFNNAGWGGAVALSSTSDLSSGDDTHLAPPLFNLNAAESQGGAIYAIYSSDVTLQNAILQSNSAGQRGGALYVDNNSDLILYRGAEACPPPACAGLYNNELDGSPGFREGTAVYAGGGSSVGIFQTQIHGHREHDQRGHPVFATDTGTIINLESVTLHGNHAQSLLTARDGAEIVAAFMTAAANSYLVGATRFDSAGGAATGGSSVEIYSSIWTDHGDFTVDATSTIEVDCFLMETLEGTTDSSRAAFVDPLLVNPAAGDLRPQPDSPAVDYCDVSQYVPLVPDLDGQPRGWDVPTHPNFAGTYDLGAYERGLLLADGFESGATTGWAQTVP